jgi:hypothetical protein
VTGVAAAQATTTTVIQPTKTQNPSQLLSSPPTSMWLRLVSRPVVTTRAYMDDDEDQEPGEDQEVQ